MSNTLGQLMERNVLEVFGERDSERRKSAISELYTENCTFFEADEQIIGRDALNAKVGHILKEAPGFVFWLAGPAEVNHDQAVALRPGWRRSRCHRDGCRVFGLGHICALYAFLHKPPSD